MIVHVELDSFFVAVERARHPELTGRPLIVGGLPCGLAQSKLVARIASRLARPRGVIHVLDGYEARFLSPLKLEVLPGLDPALARRLRAAGFRRLGQLAKLTEPQLSLLAGRTGTALGRRAAGVDPSRIRRTALPPPRIQDRDLPSASADADAIRRV